MLLRWLLLIVGFCVVLFAADLQISFEKPYIYGKNLIKKGMTLPKNSAIAVIEGFTINRARYKKYDKLKLSYVVDNNIRVRKLHMGKYWYVSQKRNTLIKRDKQTRETARKALFDAYKTALRERGAVIYKATISPNSRFIFQLDNLWGVFTAFVNTCSLEVVEDEAFKQSLKIDPDKLMAELTKSGEVKLEGIFFDTGKATLKPASRRAILAASALLKKYPTLKLEVQGHTDSIGSDASNLTLSEQRAASVKNALVHEGISPQRLESKGYGESAPVASNDTPEGRAQNRRVVLKKIGGGTEKALITIDFMQPVPGFKKEKVRKYNNSKLIYRINQNGKKHQKVFMGEEVRAYYKSIKPNDRTTSYTEILKNYENVLESFGAKIEGKNFPADQSLYFSIPDRGDGKSIYGAGQATNGGSYQIRFLVLR